MSLNNQLTFWVKEEPGITQRPTSKIELMEQDKVPIKVKCGEGLDLKNEVLGNSNMTLPGFQNVKHQQHSSSANNYYSLSSQSCLFLISLGEKGGSSKTPPSGTVLLSTRLRYGEISYETRDATFWNDDRKWRPSAKVEEDLRRDWKSTAIANAKFITDDRGEVKTATVTVTLSERVWNYCSIS